MAKKNLQKEEERKNLTFWQKCVSPMVLWNLGGMVVFIFLVLIGTWIWMDKYTHHGESVSVPDVEGMTNEYAIAELARHGLRGVVIDSTYNEKVASGEVLDQYPKKGSHVKEGREIRLVINSLNAPALPMPDLADNCSRHQAEMKLKAMGYKLTAPIEVAGDKDWVYGVRVNGQNVLAGQRVRVDQHVTLVVGNGSNSTVAEDETVADEVVDEIINDLF